MKKKSKSNLVTIGIILIIIIIVILTLTIKPNSQTNEEIVKCIGENSILYTQLGCHACETQKNMFEENYQYLNVVDCFYYPTKCSEIQATPTWKINNELHRGIQSIEELKKLTKC